MHLFTQAVGLKEFSSRPAMDKLINNIIDEAVAGNRIIYSVDTKDSEGFCEAQINHTLVRDGKINVAGITIRGLYNPDTAEFINCFYFPFVNGREPYFSPELSVERCNDREAYMIHCIETGKDVAPIFFLKNIVEYINTYNRSKVINEKMVFLSALATEGKIIFPIRKTDEQIARGNAEIKKRSRLVSKAQNGDREALDNLTIGDYDILSDVCRRIKKEDLYSIVESSFIPSGLECDSYYVVGCIKDVTPLVNDITNEEVYYMSLECNNIVFGFVINKDDLLGIPRQDFRFVGKIWLQGALFC